MINKSRVSVIIMFTIFLTMFVMQTVYADETTNVEMQYSEFASNLKYNGDKIQVQQLIEGENEVELYSSTQTVIFYVKSAYSYTEGKITYDDYTYDIDKQYDGISVSMGLNNNKTAVMVLTDANGVDHIYNINFVKPSRVAVFTIEQEWYVLNGQKVRTDAAPILDVTRTMFPLRAVSECLGVDVKWVPETKTAVVTNGDEVLKITVNEELPKNMGIAKMIDNRVYIPIRYVAEELGANVLYNHSNGTVTISTRSK